jgi:hypothetical protein
MTDHGHIVPNKVWFHHDWAFCVPESCDVIASGKKTKNQKVQTSCKPIGNNETMIGMGLFQNNVKKHCSSEHSEL